MNVLEKNDQSVYHLNVFLIRLDLFRSLQSRTVLGPSQFLTAHMRAVLVDWMVEVTRLSTGQMKDFLNPIRIQYNFSILNLI